MSCEELYIYTAAAHKAPDFDAFTSPYRLRIFDFRCTEGPVKMCLVGGLLFMRRFVVGHIICMTRAEFEVQKTSPVDLDA